ncbi:hypothetical protein [Hymenobacter yonginensis]|uniref:Uncharacterized protein n=1 Tax=Hymenobacter yonginensis TaxID=748197 RepID=A0ABY7PS28_9BACT|nr:hypothetical protein [Hymenobacter yonginensis]WBO85623.1 hypothetical protein O9Z63_05100 [Hymenobacter yonginensis]
MMIGLPGPLETALNLVCAGLFLLVLWRGRLIRTGRFLLPVLLSWLGLFVGLLFYIQHWLGARLVLSSSSVLLLLSYGFWFVQKPQKTRLDYLKMLLIASLALFGLSLGTPVRAALPTIKMLLAASYWGVLLDFVYVTYVRRSRPA